MGITDNYNHTIKACYVGYITQAIVNNFIPLLFLTFQRTYSIPLAQITLLVSLNFVVQLVVDMLAAKFVDKIGYQVSVVAAHLFCAAGLVGLGILPELLPNPLSGLILAVCCYAVGGGMIEVLISPIVEACPTEKKSAVMSLLHSFYCWGSVGVILVSTIFFTLFGIDNWQILSILWAVIPLANAFVFARVPIRTLVEEGEGLSLRQLFSMKLFWIFAMLMVCAGASEQAMSQWASAFAESGLGVSKTIGDLAGPCLFAVLMGTSRVFYAKYSERVKLTSFMKGSAILCIISYLIACFSPIPLLALAGCALCGLSVGIMWPGTFSLASEACPKGGTAMFAMFALFGDLGCSLGPTIVGTISGQAGGDLKTGLLSAILFPTLLILGIVLCIKFSRGSVSEEFNNVPEL
ncbi:MFS transporter [Novisyntrophococcus fermenticellae]|uniref:MFS transporter n=1 Tax=Novisyntrophococcus fermenticellae TaxID=2068655 RepID=UPI001E367CE2|nr:MFS transporter [Novisyntrophococcus fermenticellae]